MDLQRNTQTMSHQANSGNPTFIRFLFENSLFLIGGAALALVWANVDMSSYQRLVHFDLTSLVSGGDTHSEGEHADDQQDDAKAEPGESKAEQGEQHSDGKEHEGEDGDAADAEHQDSGGHHGLTVHFLINDILMALFFAIAGKEVWESMLPGGALSNPRKAATPLLATLGGIVGPAGLYILGSDSDGPIGLVRPGRRIWAVAGPFPARPISRSATWLPASCLATDIRRLLSCCCWQSPTTRRASLSWRLPILKERSRFTGLG